MTQTALEVHGTAIAEVEGVCVRIPLDTLKYGTRSA
jgi:hypothetical protein